ncbi:hypothetical protein V2611_04395 [Tenacibaculum maritimum]|uniref:hypothetical protein n=1 Tax=Tenacibaculum maritimum TaxID=107401 RepID=UPI003876E88F
MDILNTIGSIASIIGLLIAIFLTKEVISIKNKIKDNSSNEVKQDNNTVGGDMAGRDIKK